MWKVNAVENVRCEKEVGGRRSLIKEVGDNEARSGSSA